MIININSNSKKILILSVFLVLFSLSSQYVINSKTIYINNDIVDTYRYIMESNRSNIVDTKDIIRICNYTFFKTTEYGNVVFVEPNINNRTVLYYKGLIIFNYSTPLYQKIYFKELRKLLLGNQGFLTNKSHRLRVVSTLRKYGLEFLTFLYNPHNNNLVIIVFRNSTKNLTIWPELYGKIPSILGFRVNENFRLTIYRLDITDKQLDEFFDKLIDGETGYLDRVCPLLENREKCIYSDRCSIYHLCWAHALDVVDTAIVNVAHTCIVGACKGNYTAVFEDILLVHRDTGVDPKGFHVHIEPGVICVKNPNCLKLSPREEALFKILSKPNCTVVNISSNSSKMLLDNDFSYNQESEYNKQHTYSVFSSIATIVIIFIVTMHLKRKIMK